jgi:hypothetical protein
MCRESIATTARELDQHANLVLINRTGSDDAREETYSIMLMGIRRAVYFDVQIAADFRRPILSVGRSCQRK